MTSLQLLSFIQRTRWLYCFDNIGDDCRDSNSGDTVCCWVAGSGYDYVMCRDKGLFVSATCSTGAISQTDFQTCDH